MLALRLVGHCAMQSKDGIFGDWIAAFRKPAEDVDAEMAARISGASANRDALKKDFATPARTMVCV